MIHAFFLDFFVAFGFHLVLELCAMVNSIRGHVGITSSCPHSVYLNVFFWSSESSYAVFGELFTY